MSPEIQKSIVKAKKLLTNNRHAAMATVNEDGSPHNTPFFFIYEPDLSRVYWGSHLDSLHSINIGRTRQAFLAFYDSAQPKKGGLYLELKNCHELSGTELDRALSVHNEFRSRENKEPLTLDYYQSPNPQRMYSGETSKSWVLMSENDKNGLRVKDYRQEVDSTSIIKVDD